MCEVRYFGGRTQGKLARPEGSKFSDAARKLPISPDTAQMIL